MSYRSLNKAIKVEEQTLTPFERQDFTVVEWGGCEVKQTEAAAADDG